MDAGVKQSQNVSAQLLLEGALEGVTRDHGGQGGCVSCLEAVTGSHPHSPEAGGGLGLSR